MNLDQVKKMLAMSDTYAKGGYYQAADRQIVSTMQEVINALARCRDLTVERVREFQEMAILLRDE